MKSYVTKKRKDGTGRGKSLETELTRDNNKIFYNLQDLYYFPFIKCKCKKVVIKKGKQ